MHQYLFFIGDFPIRSYGLVLSLSIILATGVAYFLAKQDGRWHEHIVNLGICCGISGIIGARLWDVFFFDFAYYGNHLNEIFYVWQGGMAIQGGIVFGVIAGIIYARRHKIDVLAMADIVAPAIILGQAIGRCANLLNGDAFGAPTGSDFGIIYPVTTLAYRTYGDQPLWPAEIWEGQLDFVIFALLLIIVIVIIFDISEHIADFVDNHAPLKEIAFKYYGNFIPKFVNMFSPMFVFIAVIFFTSKLASNSEIVAILAGGISFKRLMYPYFISATVIALFSLVLNLFLIPPANKGRQEFQSKYIKTKFENTNRDMHYQMSPGNFLYVESFSVWNKTAYRFTLETIEDHRLVSKLSAESAAWDSTKNCWALRNYHLRKYVNGKEILTSGHYGKRIS